MRIVQMENMEHMDLPPELFQEIMRDHSRNPRNVGRIEVPPAVTAKMVNPICGDEVEIFSLLTQGVLENIVFTGQGCAISQASASLMTVKLRGKSLDEVAEMIANFQRLMRGETVGQPLGELRLFAEVRKFPSRVICATLAWQALEKALETRSRGNLPLNNS